MSRNLNKKLDEDKTAEKEKRDLIRKEREQKIAQAQEKKAK